MALNYSDLKKEYRLGDHKHDPWGTTMAWLFAVADYLTFEGNGAPDSWEFTPAMGGPDTESYEFETLKESDLAAVEQFGALLHRHDRLCRHFGKDY